MRSSVFGRVLAVAALGTSIAANALVLTPPVTVTKIHSYTDYGAGDVIFNVDATIAGCEGFWLKPSDAGFKQTYAALLMAKAAGIPVVVYAYDNDLWAGGPNICRVRTLSPQ
jgi:hypothetical protein